MICPVCHHNVDPIDDDFSDPTDKVTLVNRLKTKKEILKSVIKYSSEARDKLWSENKGYPHDWRFDLLIAVESLERYLRADLNWQLEREGLSKISKNP